MFPIACKSKVVSFDSRENLDWPVLRFAFPNKIFALNPTVVKRSKIVEKPKLYSL